LPRELAPYCGNKGGLAVYGRLLEFFPVPNDEVTNWHLAARILRRCSSRPAAL